VAILFFKEHRIAVAAIISLMAASIVASVIQLFLSVAMFSEVSSDNINPVLHAMFWCFVCDVDNPFARSLALYDA